MGRPSRRGMRRGGLGGGVGLIIIVVAALFFGVDPTVLLQGGGMVQNTPAPQQQGRQFTAEEQELADFVSAVLGTTEDAWRQQFPDQIGETYQDPRLVLFTDQVRSACGIAGAAVGPFYCPGDRKIYIDLSFFRDLRDRFKAPGDFAQAYVIAHEVGHHVQTLLGISQQVHQARSQVSKSEYNKLSVRLELQADCLAGVWAHHADAAQQILESGDVEEALTAAEAIGDDRIQKRSQGYVVPDSFTHGSSAQRVHWFQTGLQSGRVASCDTFNAAAL